MPTGWDLFSHGMGNPCSSHARRTKQSQSDLDMLPSGFECGPRPTKRRRVEPMPALADGFNSVVDNTTHRMSVLPMVAPAFGIVDSHKEKRRIPVLQTPPNLQDILLRPAPNAPNQKLPLKQVLPPTFPLLPPPNRITTKQIHPPPIKFKAPLKFSEHDKEKDRDLKTISTTSIGLLNALSSSNDGEDLAAFLLPHRNLSSVNTVTATSRGIELSPEKRGKGTNPKFISRGLAARASALYNRAHTSLALWKKETERRASSKTNAPTFDLTATIVNILYFPRHPTNKLSPVISLCRIHQTASAHYSYDSNQLYKIVFSLSQLSLDRCKEGITVRIFHPWHELPFNLSSIHDANPNSLTSTLPLPLSLPSTPDLPINETTALLCSRFIF